MPREVDELSLWEYSSVVDGFNAANGGKDAGASRDELERLSSLLDTAPMTTEGKDNGD